MENKRRNFIKFFTACSLGMGGAFVFASQNNKSPQKEKKPHFGMIFDQNKCVGCSACEDACKKVNLIPKDQMRLYVEDKTDPKNLKEKRYLRISCQQCLDAPCVQVCPTLACHRDSLTNIVTTKASDCIGCKYCIVACPYDVRFINKRTMAADHCNFCLDTNLANEKNPACIEACKYKALVFGDLNDENSYINQILAVKDSQRIKPELGTKPSLRYIRVVKLGV